MSNRLKRTLWSAAQGAAMLLALTAMKLSQGASPLGFLPWGVGFAALIAATTWYTWWFHGDSPKAVALREKQANRRSSEWRMPDR
jgi:hypothetical protein